MLECLHLETASRELCACEEGLAGFLCECVCVCVVVVSCKYSTVRTGIRL